MSSSTTVRNAADDAGAGAGDGAAPVHADHGEADAGVEIGAAAADPRGFPGFAHGSAPACHGSASEPALVVMHARAVAASAKKLWFGAWRN